jgi:signal transduction histidine kinase
MMTARKRLAERLASARAARDDPGESARLTHIEHAVDGYWAALDRLVVMRRSGADPGDVALAFQVDAQPARDDVNQAFAELASMQEKRLRDAKKEATATVSRVLTLLVVAAAFAVLLALALGIQLTRSLRALRDRREAAARHLAEAEALNRELDAFAGRVAHDIRNLLSPLALAAAMLPRESDRADRVRALADRIQRGIDRALALMSGLLAFSRSGAPDSGAACSVAAVVDEALDQLSPIAGQPAVQLVRCVEDVEVSCSREMLNVVVLNVAGNALKYMAGRDRRCLSISTRVVDGVCEIVIVDTGPGIPESALGRIFQPFYRVPGSAQPGAGIGLATVARIVEAHGGHVAVESKLGEGTTFTIALPLAREGEAPWRRAAPDAPVSSTITARARRDYGGSSAA